MASPYYTKNPLASDLVPASRKKRANFSVKFIPSGWEKTNPGPAISAFARTCEKWAALPGDEPISARAGYGGRIEDWMPACRILPQYQEAGELRRFFEDYFAPFIISTEEETNKLTGYYEPEIPGFYAF